MHELSIASTVLENVLEFVDAHEIKKVLQVRLLIGELVRLEAEQLRFCYDAITRQSPLEDSILEIEMMPAQVNCPHCSYQGQPKYWEDPSFLAPVPTVQCPQCGRTVNAIHGHECEIKAIKCLR